MLAGAGLGDDPPLAHALRQQRLAERVVELVRAGVVEVLALEVDRASAALREAPREVQRRGPPDEVAQQPVQLGAVAGVRAGLHPRLLELRQRGHQRLWHVLSAVAPEAVLDRAHGRGYTPALTAESHGGSPPALSTGTVSCTAAKNARSSSGSLRPGAASVPLAVSSANGRAR